ncbi:MAG TPA: hypothetical protein DCY13_04935 [Verrucomicrobiales bacterium]|nr:hypothetical protein [Verrucomicrobiales bacterium]
MLLRVDQQPPSRLIPVRDRQQARDWSLALISQGIESTIFHDEDDDSWALEVDSAHCGAALRVLKQYHVENRGWNMRHELPGVHLAFDWGCLGWAVLMAFVHHLAARPGSPVREAGMLSQAAAGLGEWWRVLTAMTLHGDIGHLASNLATGTLLLGLAMARHGSGAGLLGAWLAGALANVAALQIYGEQYRSLGASGMVMAMLGMLTATGAFEAVRHLPGWRRLFGTLAAGLMLFVLTGSDPTTDVVVHFGGFVAGLMVGALLELVRDPIQRNSRLQFLGMSLFLGSFVVAWLLALSR